MVDYGAFCYLDVQKTGSTFIESFLEKHSALPLLEARKHGRISHARQVSEGKIFFITCRDPVPQWRSLYFYGCDGKGAAAKRIRKRGRFSELYDGSREGMNAWISAMLEPENCDVLSQNAKDYRPAQAAVYGFQTHRFLRMSFLKPRKSTVDLTRREDVLRIYREKRLHSHIIRNEELNAGLAALVTGPLRPFMKDAEGAAADLREAERVNASSHTEKGDSLELAPEVLERIRAREWFFYEVLGYA